MRCPGSEGLIKVDEDSSKTSSVPVRCMFFFSVRSSGFINGPNWTGKLGADDAGAMKATNEKAKGLIDRSDKPYP